MEQGPLPPHERSWRHPSELGPPAHEPTSPGGRALIASAATLSLLLVGVLVLSMTPRRSGAPESAGATMASVRMSAASIVRPPLPLVTPVGDDGLGVTTTDAVAAAGGPGRFVQARLPSGDVVGVEVLGTDESGDVTIVELERTDADPYQLAAEQPEPTDTVLVQADRPMVVSMTELARLDVDEATPVLDERGRLIGLCTGAPDHRWVVAVGDLPSPSTTTTSSVALTTVAPTTTIAPATTVRPTVVTSASTAAPTTTVGPTTPSTSPTTGAPTTAAPTTGPTTTTIHAPGVSPDGATSGGSD